MLDRFYLSDFSWFNKSEANQACVWLAKLNQRKLGYLFFLKNTRPCWFKLIFLINEILILKLPFVLPILSSLEAIFLWSEKNDHIFFWNIIFCLWQLKDCRIIWQFFVSHRLTDGPYSMLKPNWKNNNTDSSLMAVALRTTVLLVDL